MPARNQANPDDGTAQESAARRRKLRGVRNRAGRPRTRAVPRKTDTHGD